jgi:phospholipid-translocating P-type ATPase (flippase)
MEMKKLVVQDSILDASRIGGQHGDILLAMAVCNNVLVIDNDYKAESPDELAFVTFAKRCGVNLVRRTQTEIAVDFFGSLCTFELLAMLPFDAERKRQSVILRREDGAAVLFCKGADSVISARSIHFEFDQQISDLASQGLRTLVFASKELPSEELENWLDGHRAAEASLCDRDLLIAQSAHAIETNLVPIGATGLEDKLQAEVPETISWIRDAGVQLWVLTGDKLETAISIGRTSGVILSDSSVLSVSTSEQSFSELVEGKEEYYHPILIAVGEAVEDRWNEFLEVAAFCRAVILARASPFVKAHVAQLLRDSGHRVMAVGDGANDVCMLQTAHVGVGIYGREGSQAALSADITLPRFRFLRRLLMVHGHWPFRRLGVVAVYMLYKNVVFIFGQLWFAFETLWSPTPYYEPFLMTCFNLLFISVPPAIFGFWEEDLPQEVLLANPQLYLPEYDPLANGRLFMTIGIGIYQSAAAFFGVRLWMPRGSLVENGTLTFLVVVAIVETQIIMWQSSLNVWCVILYIWHAVVVFVIIIIYCEAGNWELVPVLTHSLRTGVIWFGCAVTVGLALVPVWIGEAVVKRFWPSPVYQFAEAVHEQGRGKGGELDLLSEAASETQRRTVFARVMEP